MKSLSFILAFVVLFQSFNFEISDVVKIPNFIDDMSCHIAVGESIGEFLADHYNIFADDHLHNDDTCKSDAHGELPFKHQHLDKHIQLVFVFFSNDFQTNFEEHVASSNNFEYKEPSTNLFTASLFQPPRI